MAAYASVHEFLEHASFADAACIVLDQQLPGMTGLELLEHLSGQGATPPVVFLSADGDAATGVAAMKLGAVDYLLKPVDSEVLVAAVQRAQQRHAAQRQRQLEREACRLRVGRLTERECQVMAHVIRGRLNKQIAADLDIAEQTVKQHRGRVMDKIGVRSVVELMRVCEAAGVVGPVGGNGVKQPS